MLNRMLRCLLVLGASCFPAMAQQATTAGLECKLGTQLKDSSDPILARLKGTVEHKTSCSASLVTVPGRSLSKKAWVLTAGHCIGMGKSKIFGTFAVRAAGEVFHNFKLQTAFTLDTGNLAEPRTCIGVEQLLYATLTGRDIALYQLSESYDEIERRTGVKPFVMASDASIPPGIKIETPSAYHQKSQSCMTGDKVDKLKEFEWEWGPAARMSLDCKIIGGYSGSPVVRSDSNQVIGVVGTTYEGSGQPCALNNPCEVDEKGAFTVADKGQSYFHFVQPIFDCLSADMEFDLNAQTCRLLKPK